MQVIYQICSNMMRKKVFDFFKGFKRQKKIHNNIGNERFPWLWRGTTKKRGIYNMAQ